MEIFFHLNIDTQDSFDIKMFFNCIFMQWKKWNQPRLEEKDLNKMDIIIKTRQSTYSLNKIIY